MLMSSRRFCIRSLHSLLIHLYSRSVVPEHRHDSVGHSDYWRSLTNLIPPSTISFLPSCWQLEPRIVGKMPEHSQKHVYRLVPVLNPVPEYKGHCTRARAPCPNLGTGINKKSCSHWCPPHTLPSACPDTQFKALAKRTRKSPQVLDLRSTCVSFGHPLALTCDDLRWVWSSSNLYASRRKSSPFGQPTQVDTNWSQVNFVWNLRPYATCVNLRVDLRIRLATLRKSIPKFWFCKLTLTCVDLRVRLARA